MRELLINNSLFFGKLIYFLIIILDGPLYISWGHRNILSKEIILLFSEDHFYLGKQCIETLH